MKAFFANIGIFLKKYIAFFSNMLKNSDGKPSTSGFSGLIIVSVGSLCFLMGTITYFFTKTDDIMSQTIIFIGIGASLLGVRKNGDNKLARDMAKNNNLNIPKPTQLS